MTYHARPVSVGAWAFDLREGDAKGLVAAKVDLGGVFSDGAVSVHGVPFSLDREGLGRTFRLLFEGRSFVRAEPKGTFSNGYDLTVEAAMLDADAPIGERTRFEWLPTDFGGGTYELHAGRERLGRIEKTAIFFRHFSLHFDSEVPLVLQAFCFALLLERLRRQSH